MKFKIDALKFARMKRYVALEFVGQVQNLFPFGLFVDCLTSDDSLDFGYNLQ